MARRKGLGKGLDVFFGNDGPAVHEAADIVKEFSVKETEAGRAKPEKAAEKKKTDRAETGKTEPEGKKTSRPAGKKTAPPEENAGVTMLNTAFLEPNASQPRKYFDEDKLQELAESIRKVGIIQPLVVTRKGDHYVIIAGERRFRAAKLAGIKEVPVLVREYSREQQVEIALIENVQRADLNPIEEAKAYDALIREFGLRQEDVAERVSKNRTTITNSMRLLKLDERVQELLIENSLSAGHARTLLSLENGDLQYRTAMKILAEGISVRETEKLVRKMLSPEKKKKEEDHSLDIFYRDMEENLARAIGSKVIIRRGSNHKGKIEIEYYSSEELERISELLQNVQS